MVIEANRDARRECVDRANEAIAANDLKKAKRLLEKAHKLDPSFDVNAYLESKGVGESRENAENSYNHFDDHYDDAEGVRNRRERFGNAHSTSGDSTTSRGQNSRSEAASAKERSRSRSRSKPSRSDNDSSVHVQRIRHCKDYYEILQVSRDCDDTTLKNSYRKLALKLHPDKCQAAGATEAFKALGNAYTVLSDPNKRQQYDDRRMNNSSRSRGFDYDVNRGFESEVTPEEIFEMFFGGGFPGRTVYRRQPGGHHFRQQHAHDVHEERSALASLLQLLPLFVLLFGALFMQLLAGDPAFSLRAENGYTIQRYTKDLRVPYYVRPDFISKHGDRISYVEQQVEEEYVNRLRLNCYREKNNRETALWRAKMSGDSSLWASAQRMEMPNCRRLEELYH
ncbi:hypothetical protein M3Y94_00960200 [Aphelenchoides besseyi]|nr:hypothetical protein M3Y94_00960200 [Aphelenchoides besseyi]KAI6224722.1 J domain-containing protein [Aphelenchoides besseyi]